MKILFRIFVLFISFMIILPNTYALEVCKMSDEYKKWLELSDEEKENSIIPAYCQESYKSSRTEKSMIESSKYSNTVSINTRFNDSLKATVTQSRYSSYEDGLVTSAKDQRYTNSCWAFSAISLVETSALKNGLSALDLAERHIEYSMTRNAFTNGYKNDGLNRELDDGGNSYFSASYFFRHDGPILEEKMPYRDYNTKIDINTMPTDKAILDVGEYNVKYYDTVESCSSSQISETKENIIKYGAVGASIYYSESYLKDNIYFYNDTDNIPNHAVTIIGWDDSISSSKFSSNPGVNGAWIVKNSWGPSWGSNGFFYISYADLRVCNNPYTFNGVKVNTYDNAYHAADTLANYSFYNNSGNFYIASKFTNKSSGIEHLDKVSVELNEGNVYEVYVDIKNNLIDQSSWIKVGSGTATTTGIKSFSFSPISVSGSYTIIVKFISGYFPMMCKTTYSTDFHYYMDITSGTNYYSTNGTSWGYTSSVSGTGYSGCEPVIYAYTKNATSASPSFSINSITSTSTPVYTYTDDYYTVNITSSNIISYDLFKIKIYNESNVDVTNNFGITNKIAGGSVIIKPTLASAAGTYTFKLSYDNVTKEKSFSLLSLISSTNYDISKDSIYIELGSQKELSKSTFLSNINLYNNSYTIINKNGDNVTDTVSYIGTGSKIKINNKIFTIIVKGDISGDGKIKSNDPTLISRYLVSIITLSNEQMIAADITGDGKIRSNDPLSISRFLVGIKDKI